ncbi:MAG: glutathione S-transferase family protein [Pseudomonadota bacterium]|nr:glutathione S-transferase family protein [Pseudomonadota bacterium]
MPQRLKIIGNYVSPYVRKVLVCLEWKGLDYEIDPIAPFVGNDEFSRLSPLRRVPVLIDNALVLNDSSVICQYLEDKHPAPTLFPRDIAERAQARWLEEFADTRLGEVVVWRLFYQLGVKRHLFHQETDHAVVAQAREVDVPEALDYLESQLPDTGFVFGTPSIADITIASFFRTAAFVRYVIDAERWPRCSALVKQTLALPPFAKLARFEECILRLPLAEQRAALLAAGAPLSNDTLGNTAPRHAFGREA